MHPLGHIKVTKYREHMEWLYKENVERPIYKKNVPSRE